jgi:hypothetical protein
MKFPSAKKIGDNDSLMRHVNFSAFNKPFDSVHNTEQVFLGVVFKTSNLFTSTPWTHGRFPDRRKWNSPTDNLVNRTSSSSQNSSTEVKHREAS